MASAQPRQARWASSQPPRAGGSSRARTPRDGSAWVSPYVHREGRTHGTPAAPPPSTPRSQRSQRSERGWDERDEPEAESLVEDEIVSEWQAWLSMQRGDLAILQARRLEPGASRQPLRPGSAVRAPPGPMQQRVFVSPAHPRSSARRPSPRQAPTSPPRATSPASNAKAVMRSAIDLLRSDHVIATAAELGVEGRPPAGSLTARSDTGAHRTTPRAAARAKGALGAQTARAAPPRRSIAVYIAPVATAAHDADAAAAHDEPAPGSAPASAPPS